jgi:hypothetical protein
VPLDVTAAQARESLLIGARIIHAVNDITPYLQGTKKDPYMYWDGEDEDENSAALALIKRYVFLLVSSVICVFNYLSLPQIISLRETKTYLFISATAAKFYSFFW